MITRVTLSLAPPCLWQGSARRARVARHVEGSGTPLELPSAERRGEMGLGSTTPGGELAAPQRGTSWGDGSCSALRAPLDLLGRTGWGGRGRSGGIGGYCACVLHGLGRPATIIAICGHLGGSGWSAARGLGTRVERVDGRLQRYAVGAVFLPQAFLCEEKPAKPEHSDANAVDLPPLPEPPDVLAA